ncbi:hypothetical protein C7N43_24105, partial [Sphingobacteriales bacterium UPWRP_1]
MINLLATNSICYNCATYNEPATALNISATVTSNIACNGGTNGAIDLTPNGGTTPYTYDWSNDGPENPDNDPQDLSSVPAGVYTVTVTDNINCTAAVSATITQPNAITISSTPTNVSCNGGSNGAIDITTVGGTSSYTYDWSNDGPENPDNDPQDLSGLSVGTYSVTVTDTNNCTAASSITITQPTALTASITGQTDVGCNGGNNGSVTIGASGGTP